MCGVMTNPQQRGRCMKTIRISGARQHNLKNVSLEIPRDKLVVMTGLSGSGKSSLAFDTIFAEGQRKYVESLSAYARQFLDQLQKPDVDFIEGLSPAIAIEQRHSATNPRSTIATTTEIYDYLRVLYASVGLPHDPHTGQVITRHTPQSIVDALLRHAESTKLILLAPLVEREAGEFRDVFEKMKREGFVRARVDDRIVDLSEPVKLEKSRKHTIEAVVDRVIVREGLRTRLADSVETALKWGNRRLRVLVQRDRAAEQDWQMEQFSTDYMNPETGFQLPTLTPRHFSFNSHLGACPACHGLGTQMQIDPELLIPDPSLSLAAGAVRPWARANKKMRGYYSGILTSLARHYGADMDAPYEDLPLAFKVALCQGTGGTEIEMDWASGKREKTRKAFDGLVPQMQRLYEETESELSRQRIRSFMSSHPCPKCEGKRLRPEILAVTLRSADGRQLSIQALSGLSISDALAFTSNLEMTDTQRSICAELLREINNRLSFLLEVGLGYLSLDRESGTLSGGEAQRIRLATQIGSGLAGVIYVLDEPSIGLHQRDNDRLIATLKRLRDLGNSVLVVEHDEDTIRAADHIVDLGPGAGPRGGELVAQGQVEDIMAASASLTGAYLSGTLRIAVPKRRVAPRSGRPEAGYVKDHPDSGWIAVKGATENNLKSISVPLPLGCLTCVTGVSGSGKSTLVDDILRRALARKLYGSKDRPGAHEAVYGLDQLDKAIVIDQSPIGRTPRSNPVTYSGAFTAIRDLFAGLPAARVRGYDAGRFSFNVKGGRCESCKGDGLIKIEMHFLADVYVECEACRGRRYNRETLEITYKGRNVADVLDLTIDEAANFFRNVTAISEKLESMQQVGLGYVRLGQSATTLSGGEAQRVKLAAELARKSTGRTMYILDEPTTGLHFADIHRLMEVLLRLRDAGNTLLIIEHNLEVIKCADWVIDLGPEGGKGGGQLVGHGTPEDIAAIAESYTGRYLRRSLGMG